MSNFQKQALDLLYQKKFKKLEKFLDSNSNSNPQLADEIRLLSLVEQGKRNEALERPLENYLAKYQDAAPNSNWIQASRLKFELKKYDEAINYATHVLNKEDDVAAAEIVALCLFNTHEYEKGYEIVCKLLTLNSIKPIYKEWEILFSYKTGRHKRVLEAWNAFHELNGEFTQKNTTVLYVIRSFMKYGDLANAESLLSKYDLFSQSDDIDIGMLISDFYKLSGRIDVSISILEKLHIDNPEIAEVKWNLALANLTDGNLSVGWELYESRWDWIDFPSPTRIFDAPKWQGENLNGKKILIWGEQGVGDQIRFLTLLLSLYDEFPKAEVTIEIDSKLIPLIKSWYPEVVDAWGFGLNDTRGIPEYQQFDYQLPSGSLPRYYFSDPAKIGTTPYRTLKVTNTQVDRMFGEFAKNFSRRVGVSWRSMLLTTERQDDYFNPEAFRQLILRSPPDVGFVLLQYDLNEKEKAMFSDLKNVFIPNEDLLNRVDLNALYAGGCELLISCGTVVATLAGIFGVPVVSWSKTDDPVNLGQEQNPWFPNRLDFRIQPSWDKVVLLDKLTKTLNNYLYSKEQAD